MRRLALSLSLVSLVAGAAVATAAVKPDAAIRYRQSAYTMIGWNFGPLAQMVKGEAPWDAAAFALRAERIAALAPQLPEGFPAGSDTGARGTSCAGGEAAAAAGAGGTFGGSGRDDGVLCGTASTCRLRAASKTSEHFPHRTQPSEILS